MFTYLYDGKIYAVQLEQLPDGTYRATVGERTYHFTAETVGGGWILAFPQSGARATAYIVTEGDSHNISLHGETYTLTRVSQRKGKRQSTMGAHGGEVTAQMPGQVREVLVSEGDTVTRGQALIILEAMKMEVRATAPADGTVRRVLVTAGNVVTRGQLLVVIEQAT